MTFAGCVVIYLEKGGEARFIGPILEKFGETRIADLTADKVSAFALEHYGHLAPASVKRFYYTPLNAAIRKGCKEHRVAAHSFEAPKTERKTIEAAPPGWFRDFFQAAHFRVATIVLFLTTTGCRVGEACRLAIGDCYFDHPLGPRALLRRTKNGRPRVVPLDPTLVQAMRRLIVVDGETDPQATIFGYAGRWSVNQAIERVCTKASLKYYSSHKLGRHAFATRLLDGGKSLQHVKDAGGWASIQIVSDAYGHLEVNETHATILDRGSLVAREMRGERLAITHNGQNRKGKTNPKKPRKDNV